MQPDLNTPIETMGEALATNNKLEVLIMRENKIKWVQYCNFWNLILTNTTLLKMNLQKTDLSDRVVEKMGISRAAERFISRLRHKQKPNH